MGVSADLVDDAEQPTVNNAAASQATKGVRARSKLPAMGYLRRSVDLALAEVT